jgi:hypothetical protein
MREIDVATHRCQRTKESTAGYGHLMDTESPPMGCVIGVGDLDSLLQSLNGGCTTSFKSRHSGSGSLDGAPFNPGW